MGRKSNSKLRGESTKTYGDSKDLNKLRKSLGIPVKPDYNRRNFKTIVVEEQPEDDIL